MPKNTMASNPLVYIPNVFIEFEFKYFAYLYLKIY